MLIRASLTVCILVFSMCASVFADQRQVCVPLSITELLDLALTNNPETRTSWWNARRAAAAVGIAKSGYYPDLTLHSSVTNGYDYKFPNGHETFYTSAGAEVFLNYLLLDFGERRANNDAAKAALCAAGWQTEWTIQRVMHEVISSAYTYLYTLDVLASRRQSLQDAQTTLCAAEELNRAGLRSITDVYTMRATVSEMEIAATLQAAEADIARAELAASIGTCVDAPLAVMPLPDPTQECPVKANLNDLINASQQVRSDIMAKRSILREKIAMTKKASTAYLPKITFDATGGYRHYFHDHAHGLQYDVALNFDYPFFNGFESTYQKRLAYSNMKMTETELEQMQLDIALEVLTYSRWFEAAQGVLQLANDNLQNSIKSFEGVLEKYKAGTQSIFDLTIAQRQLAEARIKQSDAKTRWYRSLAQLAYATGTITSYRGIPCVTGE